MRDTTKKLSGPQKDKFFERLYASEAGISEAAAASLTRRTSDAVSSVQVRPKAYEAVRKAPPAVRTSQPQVAPAERPEPAHVRAPAPVAPKPDTNAPAVEPKPFDAYAFGLVPLYQKEGREALLARLATIISADDLRQMARAQQVSLPAELRTADASPDTLRTAIADAVAKRIADRKAAAG